MMVGILFTARLGSNRLPQKHLIEANNKPFIEWLVIRFINEFKKEIKDKKVAVIIATSDESLNRKFEDVFADYDEVEVYYGSVSNIPKRHLECADKFNLSHIISIDGDDILCSPKGARIVYEGFSKYPQKDIVGVYGLPIGLNSSGYTVAYLRKCMTMATQKKIETGWGRVFVDPDKIDIKIGEYDIYDKLRFTLDYDEDAKFFKAVIDTLNNEILGVTDQQLIDLVQKKQLDAINSHLFDIYWNNFNTLKEDETNNGQ